MTNASIKAQKIHLSSNRVSIKGNKPLLKSVPKTCFKATNNSCTHQIRINHSYTTISLEENIERIDERGIIITFLIDTESEHVTSRFTILLHILSS